MTVVLHVVTAVLCLKAATIPRDGRPLPASFLRSSE